MSIRPVGLVLVIVQKHLKSLKRRIYRSVPIQHETLSELIYDYIYTIIQGSKCTDRHSYEYFQTWASNNLWFCRNYKLKVLYMAHQWYNCFRLETVSGVNIGTFSTSGLNIRSSILNIQSSSLNTWSSDLNILSSQNKKYFAQFLTKLQELKYFCRIHVSMQITV